MYAIHPGSKVFIVSMGGMKKNHAMSAKPRNTVFHGQRYPGQPKNHFRHPTRRGGQTIGAGSCSR